VEFERKSQRSPEGQLHRRCANVGKLLVTVQRIGYFVVEQRGRSELPSLRVPLLSPGQILLVGRTRGQANDQVGINS
jgi:hypothetical protein